MIEIGAMINIAAMISIAAMINIAVIRIVTETGIRIATDSAERDVSYWLGPLYNNIGWEYQDAGEHEAALDAFQRALASRERYPEMPALIQHAKDAVTEALRALGREDEASRP